jgi:hypothetical protein
MIDDDPDLVYIWMPVSTWFKDQFKDACVQAWDSKRWGCVVCRDRETASKEEMVSHRRSARAYQRAI